MLKKIKNAIVAGKNKSVVVLAPALLLASDFANASGLDDATTQATTIKTWLYTFLGVCGTIYIMYHVLMAWLDKKQWADVLTAIGQVAIAGAVTALSSWAWAIWGS